MITVTFEGEVEEEGFWHSEADILIEGVEADGSESELDLRGDLADVRSLAATLVAEGNCVEVETKPFGEDGPVQEIAEPGAVAADHADTAEPVLP